MSADLGLFLVGVVLTGLGLFLVGVELSGFEFFLVGAVLSGLGGEDDMIVGLKYCMLFGS